MQHVDIEELLDRTFYLGFAGIGQDPKDNLIVLVGDAGALLRYVRRDEDAHQTFFVHATRSSMLRQAATVMRTCENARRLTGFKSRASLTATQ